MAREIVTRIWCDVCLQQAGEQSEAEELPPVTVGTYKPRMLALCEPHRKELFDPLRDVLVELGQVIPVGSAEASPRRGIGGRPSQQDLTCSSPGCGHVAPNKSALASHVRNMHDVSLAELEGLPLNYECPECERKFNRPQGLAAHRRTTHGVPGQDPHANKAKGRGGKQSTRASA